MSSPKRKRIPVMLDADDCNSEEPKRRRSARLRSSLAANRRSLLEDAGAKDSAICKSISLELSEEERLAQCLQMSLGLSLQKVEAEFEDDVDDSELRKYQIAMRDAGSEVIKEMKDSGMLAEFACERKRLVPNPKNVILQSRVDELKIYGRSMKKEIKSWDAAVELRKQMSVKAAKTAVEVSSDDVKLPEDFKQFLAARPNYKGKQQALAQKSAELAEKLTSLCGVGENISKLERTATEIIGKHLKSQEDEAVLSSKTEEEPDNVLQKFIDVNATPRPKLRPGPKPRPGSKLRPRK